MQSSHVGEGQLWHLQVEVQSFTRRSGQARLCLLTRQHSCVTVIKQHVWWTQAAAWAHAACAFMLAAATSRNVLGLGGTFFRDLPDVLVAALCVGMPPLGMPGGPPGGMPGGPPGGFQRPPPGAYGPPGGFPPQGAGAPPQGLPPPPMQPMQ